jgi:hypothetical protein
MIHQESGVRAIIIKIITGMLISPDKIVNSNNMH